MTKNEWRALGVHNSYGIMKRSVCKLFISYSPQDSGRAGHGAHWIVVGNGFLTDPKGPWYDNGNKSFLIWDRGCKQSELDNVMAWVAERYGITKWEHGPWDSYFPKGAMLKAGGKT